MWRERLPGNEDLKCVRIGQGSESINVKSRYSTLGRDFAEYIGEATRRKATLKSCQHLHKPFCYSKNCQRHYEPKGWDQLTKCQTNSNTNLDHISSSESQLSIHFNISTKHSLQNLNQASESRLNFKIQNIDQTKLQEIDQDSTLYPLQNISKILTKLQLKSLAWTSI